jgi:hypothetical protein
MKVFIEQKWAIFKCEALPISWLLKCLHFKSHTIWAVLMMSVGIIANIAPYFLMYQIISPLTRGEHIDASYILLRVVAIAICEIIFSVTYVQGLEFSHISAYNKASCHVLYSLCLNFLNINPHCVSPRSNQ